MSGIMLNFAGVSAASVPGAPTIGTATATGASTATVSFTAPASDGGSVILSYTATSSPAGGTGTLVQAGSGTINVTGLSGGTSYTFTVTATNAVGTSAPSAASNSITTSVIRYLFGWGNNESNGLGRATGGNSPLQIGSADNWQTFSNLGRSWGAGIKTNGELWTWGKNNLGQLGFGDTTDRTSPVQVGLLTNWSLIAACNYSCIAVKTDGTLWTWGENTAGQLGNGNTTNYSSPKQVGGATNWATPGGTTTAGFCVKTDGTLWSWGSAGGAGASRAANSSPVQVGSDVDWSRVKGSYDGQASVMALKTGGQLWGWGAGFNGRLGLGNTTDYSSAKQVGSGSTWIDAGGIGGFGSYHTVIVKSTGELFTTGWNLYGQLGVGDTTSRSTLTQVGVLTNWKFARGGYNSSFAVTTGNKLYAWGANGNGQLGLGDGTNRSSPVQIGTDDWLDVAGGMYNKTHGIKSTL
jgi:alpha-tubulin suppressor-like RCC1 family protein